MYAAIADLKRCLACAITSQYLSFTFVSERVVFSNAICVFPFAEFHEFSIMQSNFHELWARKYASTLETRLRYTPTDCFENFPFPKIPTEIDSIGEQYYQHRQLTMQMRQEGLTAVYNRFHNPMEKATDIIRLRDLQKELDRSVAAAYCWNDFDLNHGFHETKQGVRFTVGASAQCIILKGCVATFEVAGW